MAGGPRRGGQGRGGRPTVHRHHPGHGHWPVLLADGRFDELQYSTLNNRGVAASAVRRRVRLGGRFAQGAHSPGPGPGGGRADRLPSHAPPCQLLGPRRQRRPRGGRRPAVQCRRAPHRRRADGRTERSCPPPRRAGPVHRRLRRPDRGGGGIGPGRPAGPGQGVARRCPLWDLVVVRPSASSGTNGSGVELRTVDYQGACALQRAHLPILNLEFGEDGVAAGCAPAERHWAHEEAAFVAEGDDPVPGFRLCTRPLAPSWRPAPTGVATGAWPSGWTARTSSSSASSRPGRTGT
ncbi:MAG: hypothetical protein WKG07_45955 [Hymenobacter sp.]